MLIDTHAHSAGMSPCCKATAPEVLNAAKAKRIDGIVLTNHYIKRLMGSRTPAEYAKAHIEEYEYAKKCGEETGVKVFFGIELSMEFDTRIHMPIYGISPEFLLDNPTLFDLSLEQLYGVIKEQGGALIQAHPFRGGTDVLDTAFLDGIEINCHPLYKTSQSEKILKIAEAAGIIVTCGGDYHADAYRPNCGTYLPDNIEDTYSLARYLCETKNIRLRVHEPDTENYSDTEYTRK